MQLSTVAGIAALTLLLAGPAAAAVTVMGDNDAQQCSEAAYHEQSDASAMEECTQAIEKGTLDRRDLAGTYINRGVMHMNRDDYGGARSDFDSAIKIDPTLGEGWVNRGAVNIIDKRYKDGISDIDKGLGLGTEEPAKAYYNRGVAYEGIDDEKSAYLDYQQALTLEPNWDLPKQELLRFTVTRRDPSAPGQ
jgi:tetratricopeptide (TPR) repeat protein